jgi:RHS repeat-associated protein
MEMRDMQSDERYTYDESGNLVAICHQGQRVTAYDYDRAGRLVAAHYADGTALRLAYDEQGRLVRRVRRGGQVVTYAYDEAGRLAAVAGDDGFEIGYTYDEQGRLAEVAGPGCRTRLGYDAAGRVVREERLIDDRLYTTHYRYDQAGRLAAARAPGSRRWLRYARDGLGRLSRVGLAGSRADICFTYDGPSLEMAYPNGLRARHQMRSPLHLERITVAARHAGPLLDLAYSSDERGNVTQINGERYVYDDRDRLLAWEPESGQGWGTVPVRPLPPDGPSGAAEGACTYDRNGRLVSRTDGQARRTFSYDALDRLLAVRRDGATVAEYAYDHQGRRVWKRTPAGTVVYHHDPYGFCLGESRDGRLVCLNLGTPAGLLGRVYLEDGQERAEYFHHDHLASVRAVSDEAGQVQARLDYEPFGRPRGPLPAGHEPVFAGKRLDAESGLYYFGSRYYDPASGCFLTPDSYTFRPDDERLYTPRPAGDTRPGWQDFLFPPGQRSGAGTQQERRHQLQAWLQARPDYEPYAYAYHNPVKYVDLDGHQAGWYFLYTILALVWSIPYTVGAFVTWEVWFNWVFYILISFAYAWDYDSHGDFRYKWEGHAEDRLGAWGWFINGGLAGKMVLGGAFTQGNIIIGNWDVHQSLDDTNQNFAQPTEPDLSKLITERRAGDVHELRHVNQFAWFGPFMMPWVLLAYYLANLIFLSVPALLGAIFSETSWDLFVGMWTAQWTALKASWIGLLAFLPLMPGIYWWNYMIKGGYGACDMEQDALRHSGFGPTINTTITAQKDRVSPGETMWVTVTFDPNAVGGYSTANATAIPVPAINPNNSGATIAADKTFDGQVVNLRVFTYAAGATTGTDKLTATYGGTSASVEIEVE